MWIEDQLGLSELAREISTLDPYMTSLESIRHWILKLCDEGLKMRSEE